MSKKPLEINGKDEDFLALLEENVKDVLKSRRVKPAERVQAINAGVKLLAIRHKLGGGEEENFFSK